MNVVLCGYNWIGCSVLKHLINRKYNIFVYTHSNPAYCNSLIEYCENQKIPFTTEKIDISNLPFTPDIICSVYYRYIIQKEVINLVRNKIFNLHPSLLPLYKGCSSLTWALINGERETGFTYHYIDEKIDTGNIILQSKIIIEDWDTQATLYQRVMFEASNFFLKAFDLVLENFKGSSQSQADSYYKRGCPYDGFINLNWCHEKIERFIRAMNYPPLPPAKIDEIEIKTIKDFMKYLESKP